MYMDCSQQIRTLCLSPDGGLLLAIDEDGRSLLINRRRRVLLHHFSFKGPVAAACFSPDGQYVACAVGRLLQAIPHPLLADARSGQLIFTPALSCRMAFEWRYHALSRRSGARQATQRRQRPCSFTGRTAAVQQTSLRWTGARTASGSQWPPKTSPRGAPL